MYGRPGAAVPNSRTLRHGCPLVRLVGEVDNQAGQVQVRAIAMRCDLGPPWLLGYILPRYVRSGLHEAAFVNRTERRVGARLSRAQDVVDCVAFPRSSPAGSRPGCIFYIGADVGNLPFCRVPVSMRRGFKSCAPWRSRHTPLPPDSPVPHADRLRLARRLARPGRADRRRLADQGRRPVPSWPQPAITRAGTWRSRSAGRTQKPPTRPTACEPGRCVPLWQPPAPDHRG